MPNRLFYFFGALVIFSSVNFLISVVFLLRDEHNTITSDRQTSLHLDYDSSLRGGTPNLETNLELATALLYQNGRIRAFIESQPAHTPIIFLLCRNRLAEARAILYDSQISLEPHPIQFVTVPYVIPSTLIEDHYFYTNLIMDIIDLTQFSPDDWIGSLPFHQALRHDPMIDHLAFNSSFDVIAYSEPIDYPVSCCPGIMKLAVYILVNIGESSDIDNVTPQLQTTLKQIKIMGRLGFLIRSKYIQPFSSFISRAVIFLTTDPRAQQMASETCHFTSYAQSDMQVEASFYPLLGELLASYFFHSRKLTVFTVDDESRSTTSTSLPNSLSSHKQETKTPCDAIKQHFRSFSQPKAQINALQSVIPQSADSQASMRKDHLQVKSLLESHNSSSLIYILWSDIQDSNTVVNTYSMHSWAQSFQIPSTYLMDNFFYTNLLDQTKSRTSSWIGSIRWDPYVDIDINAVNEMLSDQTLLEAGVEILSFYDPLQPGQSIHAQAEDVHQGLMNLIEYLLRSIGEREEDIAKLHVTSPDIKGIFAYNFACRPHLLQAFIQWLTRITVFLMTDDQSQDMVWRDSTYEGDAGLRKQVYGSTFFPLHSVLGERLIAYYFNARGYKIMTLRQYPTSHVKVESTNFAQTFESVRKSHCLNEYSVAPAGLGTLYDISLFYHIGMVLNWREIVEDQLSTLENCGLGYMASSMTLSYSNPSQEGQAQSSTSQIEDLLKKYPFSSKLKVNFLEASSKTYERSIMEEISSSCQKSISEYPEGTTKTTIVFYFHNKGSSKYVQPENLEAYDEYLNIQYWRKYMEYFLLEHPTLCTRAILNHGTLTCGVSMRKQPSMHYSGNFWAASCEHLKGLAKGDSWPKYNDDINVYISPEMWIGNYTQRKDGEEIKYLTLFNFRDDLYNYRAIPEDYTFVLEERTFLQNNHVSSYYSPWPFLAMYDPGNQTAIWLDYESGRGLKK